MKVCNNNESFINSLPFPRQKDFKGVARKGKAYNHPMSFDIETSSFYSHDELHEKTSIMYIWQFAIDDIVVTGRTWSEFLGLMLRLKRFYKLGDGKRLIIYVHNLGYEFQFIRKLFKWSKVFAVDSRRVCYAITDDFEFRCSYLLSGYSLDTLAHVYNLRDQKLHTLDYEKIRTPLTKLTDEEIHYCVNDVLVVNDFIKMKIEQYGNLVNIPLTSTGEVRKDARKKVLHPVKSNKLGKTGYKIQNKLRIQSVKEFEVLRQAFQGGFTHANAFEVGKVIDDVGSFDFTSSYPYVMLSERFPMSAGKYYETPSYKQYKMITKTMLTVGLFHVKHLQPKDLTDSPISLSRVLQPKDYVVNNGRIVYLGDGYIVMTNVDLEIYKEFYSFDMDIIYLYAYVQDYLPKEYVELIMDYYNKKTTLKGVKGREVEYMHAKQKLNSLYGMMVTNPLNDDIDYHADGEPWTVTPPDTMHALEKYNNSKNRFTFYPWGVFVTAYARRNLFTGIKEFGRDYIYSDTDSLKVRNYDKHMEYINSYNDMTQIKIKKMCNRWGIDYEVPKTIKGVEKPLGVWDFEGVYTHFKTLGAKRYLYDVDGDYHLTVSGINKKKGKEFLEAQENPYEAFNNHLYIPKEKTGKNMLTYIDTPRKGTIVDFQGNEYDYYQPTSIHMEPTFYNMSLSELYVRYLNSVQGRSFL